MSEAWPQAPLPQPSLQPSQQPPAQHPGTITLGEHPMSNTGAAENALGCAVYGILLQPDLGVQHPPLPPSEPIHKCGLCGHDLSHLANPQDHQCMPPSSQDRSFQCTQCLKIFHQATDLLEHQCSQVEQKPFVCGVCKMGFSLLTSLAQHHNVHSGSALKCSICEKTYKSCDAERAPLPAAPTLPQDPHDKPFSCTLCHKPFKHLSELSRHERVHTGERPYKCTLCDKSFSQSSHLVHHKRTHSSERPYKCTVCEKSFKHRSHLLRHMYAHAGEQLFQCQTCQLRFRESSQLMQHPCTPAGERPFRCSLCQKTFRRPSDLRQHERTHSEERPFHCDLCQMSFKQQYALMRHRRTHKAEDPAKCTLCEKGMVQPAQLLFHQHGAESIFKCNACQRGFSQSQELLRHKCGQAGTERPFQCTVCHKAYKRSSALQKHQATHCAEKPLRCTACEHRFFSSSEFVQHRCDPAREKPLKCSDCEKRFKYTSDLQRHRRVHTGLNMFAWIEKVIPQPPETPTRTPADPQQGGPQLGACEENVTCVKQEVSDKPPEVKPPEPLPEPEKSAGGVLSWLAQGLGKVVPQPVESPVLTRSSKEQPEPVVEQKVITVSEPVEKQTENGPTDHVESSSIGVLSWLSQGLEKVVPQPAKAHRESMCEHAEPCSAGEQKAHVEEKPAKVEEAIIIPASPPPSPLPASPAATAPSDPIQPAANTSTQTASSDKGSGSGVLNWLMQGLGKVVPVPEVHVPPPKIIEEVKPKEEEPPVCVPRRDSKGRVLSWISHGLEKVIPQPVMKDSQTVTLCQVEESKCAHLAAGLYILC
uniref:Zinc finger protein 319 n=1 Tax=Leptobrachium leishanense TaxID=445787 RepID=A0A8C5QM89_9ANUR